MPIVRPYQAQAGYLPSPYRDVKRYEHDKYTLLYLYDSRHGETKQLRKVCVKGAWRPFRPEHLSDKERNKLLVKLHLEGLWPLDKAAWFVMLPYETANKIVGYT